MNKIFIVYWSQSGNTEMMAKAIGEGVEEGGKSAAVVHVSEASLEDLRLAPAFALGCPAMGDEVLEEGEMEPFVADVEAFASGKQIALFGSYGWGDGKWMRDWVERMTNAGASVVDDEGLMCQELPDDDVLNECRQLGKKLAAF